MRLNCLISFLLVTSLASGIQSKSIGDRIFNGAGAKRGQFPWQVSMTLTKNGRLFFCGGAIISPDWILTAAHCLTDVASARVIAGSLQWNRLDPGSTSILSYEIISHEDFVEETVKNDVGLIRLPTPLKYSANIQPIDLPSEPLGSGENVTFAGWGRLREANPTISDNLLYVNLTTISNAACIPLIGDRYIIASKVCAVSQDSTVRSPCLGDSGGALVLDAHSSRPVHVGILSLLSARGCESGLPSGYSRTAFHREWIRSKTGL